MGVPQQIYQSTRELWQHFKSAAWGITPEYDRIPERKRPKSSEGREGREGSKGQSNKGEEENKSGEKRTDTETAEWKVSPSAAAMTRILSLGDQAAHTRGNSSESDSIVKILIYIYIEREIDR
jgi:hypothetical protein